MTVLHVHAQNLSTITGNIIQSDGKPVEYANVMLLSTGDSTLVKGAIADENGRFVLQAASGNAYFLQATMVGMNDAYSAPFSLQKNFEVPSLTLSEGQMMKELVITDRKQLYQHKIDRLVINVENSITSVGGTALEVLERSPGITVNRQNNSIGIVGKDGVVVMINGKISYVPVDAVIQLLQGMNASEIASIELLTTPPSNYDAEGNAGFINIVMKKKLDQGLNGSYSLSGGYGNGAITTDNISANYRKGRVNLYGSYAFLFDDRDQFFLTSRIVTKADSIFGTETRNNRDPLQVNHNMRLGLDYDVSSKTVMGILVSAYDNKWSMFSINNSFYTQNKVLSSYSNLENNEVNQWKNFSANYNIKHTINEKSFLTFDTDYLYYRDDNPNDYSTDYYDANNVLQRNSLIESSKITPIKTWVAKVDYTNRINAKLSIETGVKGILSTFENDVAVTNFIDNKWQIDPTLTNTSFLDEKVMAAYTSFDFTISPKTTAKAGLRYEWTNSVLTDAADIKIVDRQYGLFFPTIYLNRKISETLNMNWSYSKRISRPTFNQMAPFVIFFDPTTFITGNSALQPAITDAFKYDITYKTYFVSFQYAFQDSSIARFQERIDATNNRLIFEASNLDFTRTYSATFGIPIDISTWWRMQNNISGIYQQISAYQNKKPVEISLGSFQFNTTQFFKLSSSFSAELSGFYNGPSASGIAKSKSFYSINAGLQRVLPNNHGSLKFAVSDIFESLKFQAGTAVQGSNFTTSNIFDFSNRTFTLTYTRNFGRNEIKASRSRGTGSDDERRRVE